MSNRLRAALLTLAAYPLAVASVLLGWSFPTCFAYAIYLFFGTDHTRVTGQDWWPVLYLWTRNEFAAYLLGWAGIAAVAGGLSRWLARRASRATRTLWAASASRLARGGLVGATLHLLLVGFMIGYRMYRMR